MPGSGWPTRAPLVAWSAPASSSARSRCSPFGLAGIIRHTAGALSAFFGVLFALNPLVDLLPTWLRNDVINYLPLNAGNQVFVTQPGGGALGPWTGLGVLAGYAAVSFTMALLLVNHRDA